MPIYINKEDISQYTNLTLAATDWHTITQEQINQLKLIVVFVLVQKYLKL